jgi:tripartite-type tricarboxylate transporter receptor subunit TctC
MADLMAGHVQVVFDSMVSVLPHVQGGRVRALAVTSKARSSLLPDLPTIAETLPGYESTIWFGVGAPRGTPPEIVARLNREINAGLAAAEIKEKYAKLGTTPMVMTPEEFWTFSQGETDKWQQVIERAGIKVD